MSNFKRKEETRKEKKKIYIFTEGEKTEPEYFNSKKREIRESNINIKGTGRNTLDLVKYVKKEMSKKKNEAKWKFTKKNLEIDNLDEVWVVFDRDNFKQDDYDNAINRAKAEGFKIACSNPCFEIWFLLHFEFRNSRVKRGEGEGNLDTLLTKKISKIFKKPDFKYQKNISIYEYLKERENDAINNANKLSQGHTEKDNPYTNVHSLVEALNKLTHLQ